MWSGFSRGWANITPSIAANRSPVVSWTDSNVYWDRKSTPFYWKVKYCITFEQISSFVILLSGLTWLSACWTSNCIVASRVEDVTTRSYIITRKKMLNWTKYVHLASLWVDQHTSPHAKPKLHRCTESRQTYVEADKERNVNRQYQRPDVTLVSSGPTSASAPPPVTPGASVGVSERGSDGMRAEVGVTWREWQEKKYWRKGREKGSSFNWKYDEK